MSLNLIPNAEMLLGKWLREHPDMVALDARVAGATPRSTSRPWVRVTQLGAHDPTGNERLIDAMVQLDCYAGSDASNDHNGQAEAWTVALTVRAVLKSLQGTTVDGVVISRVRFSETARLPDDALEPARDRVVVTAEVMMHGTLSA